MNRRDALKSLSLILGGAITPSVATAVLSGCRATPAGAPLGTLAPAQAELVAALAELIIPTTDTPGARAAGVDRFVDAILTKGYTAAQREAFLAGLDDAEVRVRKEGGRSFVTARPEQQQMLLRGLEAEAFEAQQAGAPGQPFFSMMKELTVIGYYTSELGATQELRTNPMGSYNGALPFREGDRAWA